MSIKLFEGFKNYDFEIKYDVTAEYQLKKIIIRKKHNVLLKSLLNSKRINEYNSHKTPDANNKFMKTSSIKGKKILRNFQYKLRINIFTFHSKIY